MFFYLFVQFSSNSFQDILFYLENKLILFNLSLKSWNYCLFNFIFPYQSIFGVFWYLMPESFLYCLYLFKFDSFQWLSSSIFCWVNCAIFVQHVSEFFLRNKIFKLILFNFIFHHQYLVSFDIWYRKVLTKS